MVVFLQLVSLACVVVLLVSYSAYRRRLRPEVAAQKSEAQRRRELRLCVVLMAAAVAVCIAATLILRKIM